jgi:hypothetical protein
LRLKSNIDKIKILTDTLIDRDYVRSKVIDLFDKFCSDFPVEMNAWIVDKDLAITSKKGTLVTSCNEKILLSDIFTGAARDKNIEMHKDAFDGKSSVYVLKIDNKILLTKVMPATKKSDLVFGFSMDITSFVDISEALEAHCEDMNESSCDLIRKVKDDNLYKIVKGAS